MAYGFQNCCDGTEYFYVNGIPSSVSELETYYIDTTEGLDFCATYVELPELFYQPKTYNLVGMTAQTDCTECTTLNPCPDIIEDDIDSISSYITTTSNECVVITESFLEVTCVQTTVPTFLNPNAGIVSLNIVGGVPPYLIYSSNTTTQLTASSNPGNIQVLTNKPGGTYSFDVLDFTNNIASINCTLPAAPSTLLSTCNTQNISQFGLSDGKLFYPSIQGGTPPYFVYSGATLLTQSNFPLVNLGLNGNPYTLTIQDSGTGSNFQQYSLSCTITQPAQVFIYPNNLCIQFEYCGKGFQLSFTSAGTINNRASYTLTNASSIGVSSSVTLSFNGTNWITSSFTSTVPITLPNGCITNTVSSTLFGPTTQYPLGAWSVNSSSWLYNDGVNNTVFTLYSGTCQNTVITPTITTQGYCSTSPTPQGIATFSPVVGGLSPYTFIVDNNLIGSNTTTSSVANLTSGSHTYTITDQTGSTVTGSFIIPSTAGANLSLNLNKYDNASTFYTNTTLTGGISVRSIYRNFNIDVSILNLPSNVTLQGYFELTIRAQLATTAQYLDTYAGGWSDSYDDVNVFKNSTPISSSIISVSTSDTGAITRLNSNVSPNFIPANNNTSCTFTSTVFTRKLKRIFTVGTSSSPLTISSSDLIKFNFEPAYNFRINSTNLCRPGITFQYNIKFIPTTPQPNCLIYNFSTESITSFRQISGNNNPSTLDTTNRISY